MKKLLLLLSALALVACAKAPDQAIIGTWDVTNFEATQDGEHLDGFYLSIPYFTFNEGGIGRTDTEIFTWTLTGDELEVRTDKWTSTYTIVEPPRRTMVLRQWQEDWEGFAMTITLTKR